MLYQYATIQISVCISVCYNTALVFSIVIFCVVFIIYFVPSLSAIFLHAVFYAICKVSLFHILILQLLLLCPVKPANITHFE